MLRKRKLTYRMTPIQERRQARLAQFVASNGGHAKVVESYRLTPSHASLLSQHINKYPMGEKAARNWEGRLRLESEWLDRANEISSPNPTSEHSLPLAHDVSQARQTLALQRLSWESLMSADLSQPFELEVTDDALAPEIVRGCVARFHAAGSRSAEPGRPVLVRDAEGHHYLRDFQAGAGNRWSAVARRTGYETLESERHGLVLVAVMRGFDWP